MRDYQDILDRCKEQDIDISNCHVYIFPNNFDGEYCHEGTLSQDGKWICIPRKNYDEYSEEEFYQPVCYEVKDHFSTYLHNDTIWRNVEVFILYGTNVKEVSNNENQCSRL